MLPTPKSLWALRNSFTLSAGKKGASGQSGAHLLLWYLQAAHACPTEAQGPSQLESWGVVRGGCAGSGSFVEAVGLLLGEFIVGGDSHGEKVGLFFGEEVFVSHMYNYVRS